MLLRRDLFAFSLFRAFAMKSPASRAPRLLPSGGRRPSPSFPVEHICLILRVLSVTLKSIRIKAFLALIGRAHPMCVLSGRLLAVGGGHAALGDMGGFFSHFSKNCG